MNWSRAKTILIALFLVVDLFLLTTILKGSDAITPEIISSTVDILSANGITVSADMIPSNVKSAPYSEAENVIESYDEFAKLLLGEDCYLSGDNSFSSNGATVSFSGNSFIYKNKNISNSIAGDKNPQNIASVFLKSIGFDLSDAKISYQASGNDANVTFSNYAGSLPVFNSSVTVSLSDEEITSISGTWFNVISTRGQDAALKSITSILIDSVADFEKGTRITALDLGYTLPDSVAFHKSAVLIPVWQITTESGQMYYPDARNPE